MNEAHAVISHYGAQSLHDRVLAALAAAGLTGELTWRDLAPLDQFHSRGLKASAELAAALAPERGAHVLDVGSGLGGPARFLAATAGCRVTGIDLTPAFVDVANLLSERAGLAGQTRFLAANALTLPFADATFDHAWTLHVAMNIADRARLYGEIRRVLKPDGRLVIYEVVAGEHGVLVFPVPWARTPETSFVRTPAATRAALDGAGFVITAWEDKSADTLAWFREQRAKRQAAPSPLNLTAVMGDDFPALSANMARNLEEGRARIAQAVAVRA
jgi:SAM-dependent methyltransferase